MFYLRQDFYPTVDRELNFTQNFISVKNSNFLKSVKIKKFLIRLKFKIKVQLLILIFTLIKSIKRC